jgi:hypothetical protein
MTVDERLIGDITSKRRFADSVWSEQNDPTLDPSFEPDRISKGLQIQ